MSGFFKVPERSDMFLVDRGDSMPSWCTLVVVQDGRTAWLDLHERCFPRDAGWAIAHVAAALPDELLGCDPEIACIERDLAYVHLLDPWSDQGWIDRGGRFYGCGFGAHEHLMNALLRQRVADAEYDGFVRVNPDSFRRGLVRPGREALTSRQEETLAALGFPHLLAGMRREGTYVADRAAPPPGFAVRPPSGRPLPPPVRERPAARAAPAPSQGADERKARQGTEEREAGARQALLARLRAEPEIAPALGPDPEFDRDFGGRWDWMLRFDELYVGTEESASELARAPGLELDATAFDQVEIVSTALPGIHVSSGALDVLARFSPGPRP